MNKATREKRKHEMLGILKLEVATALDRCKDPISFLSDVPEKREHFIPVAGGKHAWLPKVWVSPKDKNGKKIENAPPVLEEPRTIARAFFRVLTLIQKRVRIAGNAAIRSMWLNLDKPLPALDTTQQDPEKKKRVRLEPRADEREVLGTLAYRVVGRELVGGMDEERVPQVSSSVTGAMSRRLAEAFTKSLKKVAIGEESVMNIKDSWPVWLRPTGWRFSRRDGMNISVNLDGTWWNLALRLRKAKQDNYVRGVLSRVAAGEYLRKDLATAVPTQDVWAPGTMGLYREDNKWFVLLQYRRPKPPVLAVKNNIIVHCGLKVFTVALTVEEALNRSQGFWVFGDGFAARRGRIRARRKEIQRCSQLRVPGKGHMYQVNRFKLDNDEAEVVDSFCRKVAARIVGKAINTRSKIWLPELRNIRKRAEESDLDPWIKVAVHQAPWFKIVDYVTQDAAKHGVEVEKFKTFYHTRRCPSCGSLNEAALDFKNWRFNCVKCTYSGHIDRIAIENAIIDLSLAKKVDLPQNSRYWLVREELQQTLNEASKGKMKGKKPPKTKAERDTR